MTSTRTKIFCLLLPILAFLSVFFVGCGEDDSVLYFLGEREIDIMLGTAEDSTATARLISSDMSATKVSYDSEIISYDLNSGSITPKSAGKTAILARLGDKTAVININVTEAIYCVSLNLSTSYFLKLTNTKPTEAIIPHTNTGYNMGFVFESLTPSVVTVDTNGVLTPVSSGEAVVRVYAKSACVSGEYTYITATTNVIVEEVATKYTLELLDSGLNLIPLSVTQNGFEYYEITSRELADDYYVMRLTCNVPLKDKLQSFSANSVDSASGREAFDFSSELQSHTVISRDGKVLYRPFYATRAGFYYAQFTLDDSGLNYYNLVESNMLRINIVGKCEEINLTSSLDDTNGVAYMPTNGEAKFYVDVDMGSSINASFDYSVDNAVTATRVDNRIYLSTSAVGTHTLVVTALDGGLSASINFEIRLASSSTEIVVDKTNFILNVGEYTTVAFSPVSSSLEPRVICLDEKGAEIDYDNTSLYLDLISGNLYIEALKPGSYFLKITTNAGLSSQIISILVI